MIRQYLRVSGLDICLDQQLADAHVLLDVLKGDLEGSSSTDNGYTAHLFVEVATIVSFPHWGNHRLFLKGKSGESLLDQQPEEALGVENEVVAWCGRVTDNGVHDLELIRGAQQLN